jgi:hypothetical protein
MLKTPQQKDIGSICIGQPASGAVGAVAANTSCHEKSNVLMLDNFSSSKARKIWYDKVFHIITLHRWAWLGLSAPNYCCLSCRVRVCVAAGPHEVAPAGPLDGREMRAPRPVVELPDSAVEAAA